MPDPFLLGLLAQPSIQQESAAKQEAAEEAPVKSMEMELNIRSRYLVVPNGLLDGFFSGSRYDRPTISAYSVGLEWVLKPDKTNWILYYEYMGNLMEEGYWDDIDDAEDDTDGVWLRPEGLALHSIGFNVANEIPISDKGQPIWGSFLIGGGLGVGVIMGSMERWHHGTYTLAEENFNCLSLDPAYIRKDLCPNSPDAEELPVSVLPILDFSLGFRLHIHDRANVRIDFGIHDLPYVGMAAGASW